MKISSKAISVAAASLLGVWPTLVSASETTVYKGSVVVTNLAPVQGTCQTPVWVGIHDGSFDVYDRNAPVTTAVERIAEDGNTGPISSDFLATNGAVWDGTVGERPICHGETVSIPFEVSVTPGQPLYFSYASMVVPSNDAFLANGNPIAHEIFDASGRFMDVLIEDVGGDVLDAGTEVNDEIPLNTAFFGQLEGNTGTDQGGVVTSHPGLKPVGSGGILDDPDFSNADFLAEGYRMMEIKVVLDKTYKGRVTVVNEAPALGTCQTPVWVGIHDGSFDVYDRNAPASPALERIAEDGNVEPLIDAFAMAPGGVWDDAVSDRPFCSGESATTEFEITVSAGQPLYFSYTTMVVPSNDAFLANGNPKAFMAFDYWGKPMSVLVEDFGTDVLDAGTEENDEIPQNTAFFGQMVPDSGIVEGSVIVSHPGLQPVGSGGILDNENFLNADFTQDDYRMLTITVEFEEIVEEAPVPPAAVDEPMYGYLRSRIERNQDWCMTAAQRRANGNMLLHPCDYTGRSANQLFRFEEGQLRSVAYEGRCVQVGFGRPEENFDGVRIRLGECNNEATKFAYDPMEGYLQVDDMAQYCVSFLGTTPNSADTIHARECLRRADYKWDIVPYDVVMA